MIGWKRKCLAGNDGCESFSIHAKSGKTLRERGGATEPEKRKAGREAAAGYPDIIVHRRKS
jgi:hypothetical protein